MNKLEWAILTTSAVLLGLSVADELGWDSKKWIAEQVNNLAPSDIGGNPPSARAANNTSCFLEEGRWQCR